ncbi:MULTISPECIES: ABC transporter permease [Micrococcaceae]|uniref:ABC transporter permease n=1 Tax=Micrococcaceae TaxID=1268 RepID=UPI001035AA97|nr:MULTISPECIES: ABC transporter permease [Micrococcaceae]TAP25619.1 ABC transporter permease [Arthrobacter sp. S41]UXN31557.1 ABC transporter permease [Glutamicibacter sp. M10]
MNLLSDAFKWLVAPEQWEGKDGLAVLLGQHLLFTFISVVIAGAIAIPVGWAIGHTGKGREIAVGAAGIARAVPSFGLLILLVLLLGVTHKPEAAVLAFVVLAIPSLLAGAYTGFEAIDRKTIDAARAMGMTEWQILFKVEIPLGLSLLVGGIRAAVLQVVATVTIAAYVNLGGLGLPIITGLNLRRFDMVLGGALLVAVVALLLDMLLAMGQKAAVPRALGSKQRKVRTQDSKSSLAQEKELT